MHKLTCKKDLLSSSSSTSLDSSEEQTEPSDHDGNHGSPTSSKHQPSNKKKSSGPTIPGTSSAGSSIPGTSSGRTSSYNKFGIGRGMRHQFTVGSRKGKVPKIKTGRRRPKGIGKKK